MSHYTIDQEFFNIPWETAAPVTVFIDLNLERIKVRGFFAVAVSAPDVLEEKIPDPQNLPALLGGVFASQVKSVLGEIGASVYTVEEMTGTSEQVCADLAAKMDAPLASLGVRLTMLVIAAVEAV